MLGEAADEEDQETGPLDHVEIASKVRGHDKA